MEDRLTDHTGVYSTKKIAWHPDRLEGLRHAKPVAPLIVQLMPTNVCNQACNFCMISGTKISCEGGQKEIQYIVPGDQVFWGEELSTVTQIGKRMVEETIFIQTEDGSIELTKEHPVCTLEGWVLAEKLSLEDVLLGENEKSLHIQSIIRRKNNVMVYNFSCDPYEAYYANGIGVHNCSYGSGPEAIRAKIVNPDKKLWKNQQLFEGRDTIPENKIFETIDSMVAMGVKCVEITGGGEPLAYPYIENLFIALKGSGLEVALVTNGTLLTEKLADLIGECNFSWCRVSIDAGLPEQYAKTRNVPPSHWDKAWKAVEMLSKRRRHPEAVVGVGMVVDRDNWQGVESCCALAYSHGADNVRISAAFTPEGPLRFSPDMLKAVPEQVLRAKEQFECSTFKIHDLFEERRHNVQYAHQAYAWCMWKEIGCVIGADQNVFSCCSLAYNKLGLMGSIKDQTFEQLWFGDAWKWRQEHDPRLDCKIHCLYEKRNLEGIQIVGDKEMADELSKLPPPKHANFV
jgi:MoaA/NifB/PqqE/SkfB family radical SAM enzyme